jgi:choloylglycine hydrolase
MQMFHLNNFMALSSKEPGNQFSDQLILKKYSNGMGSIGLPGDWSSQSRFVKAVFVKMNSMCQDSERSCVNQFFHILDSVSFPRGCVELDNAMLEITQYSCCCDTKKGIYYYTTYGNRRITAIQMANCPLDANQVITFPLQKDQDIHWEN